MDYKILIKLFVPEIEQVYELYIPINKTVYQVCNLLNLIVKDISKDAYPQKNIIHLCNHRTGELYKYEELIRNTNIRNGTELIIY